MGQVLAAVAPAIISAGVQYASGKLASKGNKVSAPTPAIPGIKAGGFTGHGGKIRITPERQALTGGISSLFSSQADELARRVGPGLAGLRGVRLDQINDAARKAIGNLDENLRLRRVRGSSFAGDALARAELEAGRLRSESDAKTFLEGIDLLNQENSLRRSSIITILDDLDKAADIGLKLGGQAAGLLADNNRIALELAAKNAQGAGQFAGQISGKLGDALGSAGGNFLSGLGGGGGGGGFSPGGFTSTGVPIDTAGRVFGGI